MPGGNRKWWAAPPGAAHRSYNPGGQVKWIQLSAIKSSKLKFLWFSAVIVCVNVLLSLNWWRKGNAAILYLSCDMECKANNLLCIWTCLWAGANLSRACLETETDSVCQWRENSSCLFMTYLKRPWNCCLTHSLLCSTRVGWKVYRLTIKELCHSTGWELLYHRNPSVATLLEEVCGPQGETTCWKINHIWSISTIASLSAYELFSPTLIPGL